MEKNHDVLNAREAADFLGAHVETLRRLARKGKIPSYKMGKDWRFRKKALMEWAEKDHLQRKPLAVLVIDDEEGVRKMVRRFLEAEGYRIYLAASGNEGLSIVNREPIHLILLDLKMPGMNGAMFLREFRKAHGNLPVIMVTGYPDSHLMLEAMKYGPLTLIAKPVDKRQLIQAVGTALHGQEK
jgi:excisionase family DNA binding protein